MIRTIDLQDPPHVMPRHTWERMQAAATAAHCADIVSVGKSEQFKKLNRALEESRSAQPK